MNEGRILNTESQYLLLCYAHCAIIFFTKFKNLQSKLSLETKMQVQNQLRNIYTLT